MFFRCKLADYLLAKFYNLYKYGTLSIKVVVHVFLVKFCRISQLLNLPKHVTQYVQAL
jgi:hypothetical protein